MSETAVPTSVGVADVDQATLTTIVKRALGRESVEVVDWQYRPLHGGAVAKLSGGGVYLFQGIALDRGETLPWRVVLKVALPFLDKAVHEAPTSRIYWKRELLVYESDLLADLPDGLAAPRYLGSKVLEGNTTCLWLEYVEDAYHSHWPLERYALAARHLGRLNGQFLTTRPLPSYPWLARKGLRQEQMSIKGPGFLTEVRAALDQKQLHPILPPPLCEALLAVGERRDEYLSVLDRLPQTLAHRETFRRNLLARRDELGNDQTVLIDWTHVGIGPLGEDLAQLVFFTVVMCDVEASDFRNLADTAYKGYLEGLRDAGWRGDPRVVRLGYCLTAVLRFGLYNWKNCALDLSPERKEFVESFTGRPLDYVRATLVEIYRHALECAHEAESLMEAPGLLAASSRPRRQSPSTGPLAA